MTTDVAKDSFQIFVNGETQRVHGGCTVDSLLCRLGMGERRVAVAINREVVPRSVFAERQLEAGDRVEILEAVGGG